MTSELPPALRPWSQSLAFLSVEAALHLGPLVRRIDALVRRHDATNAAQGEPDGYGGLRRRGRPDQLLLSDWLLADELPMEFLRRAVSGELLYIEPVAKAPQPKGRVAVAFDAGPDQLGAARLVQLAVLVVMHRRAAVRGSELVIGDLGDPAQRWHAGELPELFGVWRAARQWRAPTPSQLSARADAADDGDELWIMAGAPLAAACPQHRLLLSTREVAFDEAGVTSVELRLQARSTILTLPTGPVSVQALRGRALRRAGSALTTAIGPLSCPSFASTDRRLVMRGEAASQLVVAPVPTTSTGGEARLRTHRFDGPVVAAASLGRRLVALVLLDDVLVCRVVGKHLGRLEHLAVALADLDVDLLGDPSELTASLPALYFDRGALLCRLAGDWWRLRPDEAPQREPELVAVGPDHQLDTPLRYLRRGTRLDRGSQGETLAHDIVASSLRIVAGVSWVAWSCDRLWHLSKRGLEPRTIAIDESCEVLGIVAADRGDDPALLTRSGGGMLLRLHAQSGTKTLTDCSGIAIAHALHPSLALLAIQRDEESVEVVDISSGERLVAVRAP